MTKYQQKVLDDLQDIASQNYCIFELFLDNLCEYCKANDITIASVDKEKYCFITSDCQIISFNEII